MLLPFHFVVTRQENLIRTRELELLGIEDVNEAVRAPIRFV